MKSLSQLARRLSVWLLPAVFLPIAAQAAALNISSLELSPQIMRHARIPPGVVQFFDTPIQVQMHATDIVSGQPLHLILTSADTSVMTSIRTSLPFPLRLNHGGLKLTFTGTLSLQRGQHRLSRQVSSYRERLTRVQGGGSVLLSLMPNAATQASATLHLYPVIYCDNPAGCTLADTALKVPSVRAALVTDDDASRTVSETVMTGGTLAVRTGCTLTVLPTDFSGIELHTDRPGSLLGKRTSNIYVQCSRPGLVHVTFTPTRGTVPNDSGKRIAATNLAGIGLAYDTLATPAETLSDCNAWGRPLSLGETNADAPLLATVHWQFYQYQQTPATGALHTTVQYEFWVD